MKNKGIFIGYILAFIALIFLSVHGVGLRFLSTNEGLNPFFLVFLRFLGGVSFLVFFLPFLSKKGDIKSLFKKENNILKNKNFWFASIFFFLNLIVFIFGTQLTSASNVILIESLYPILVGILTLIYYKNSNYGYKERFYILVFATIGTTLLFSNNSFLTDVDGKSKMIGDILSFVAMVFFAIFSFFYVELRKDYKNSNGLVITILFLSVGLIFSLPALFIFYKSIYGISNLGIYFLLLISFGSTGIAYLSWFLAGRYLSAITLAMLFNIVGITTIISEYLLYGKNENEITYKLLLGTIIILGAATYMNYLDNKSDNNLIDKK